MSEELRNVLLAVDIGNSHIVVGLWDGSEWRHSWRIATDRNKTADEYAAVLQALLSFKLVPLEQIHAVALSSVVPPVTAAWQEMCRSYLALEPLVITNQTDTGIELLVDNPREVGADRIVNAVAGKIKYGTPTIIVDFGTATTVDAVDTQGRYVGGAIAPGVGISTEALFSRTALLYRVPLVSPPQAIGKNTVHGMQSGIIYGFTGQVDALTRRIQAELGAKAVVVATGGLAGLIAPESETIEVVDPMLTLDGLVYLHNRSLVRQAG